MMLKVKNAFYDNNLDWEEINPYLHNIQLLYNESDEHNVPQREMYNFLIIYIVDGEMDFTFSDEKVILTAGEYVLIPPKVLYKETIADGKTCKYFVVSFDLIYMFERTSWDRNELYLKYCRKGVDKAPFDYRYYSESDKNYFFLKKQIIVKDADTEKFCDILRNILDLHLRRQFSDDLSIDLSIKSYLLKFLSSMFCGFSFQSSSNTNPVISYFINYVMEHYGENFVINEVVKKYGYSPNHFSKIFKKAIGVTPFAYLLQYRIMIAKELLAQGFAVGKVSYMVGFGDALYFSKVFKKNVGNSPKQYQRQIFLDK